MKLEQGARIVVERWLKARPEEVLHFITDETKLREMQAFVAAAESCGAVPKVSILPSDSIQSGDCIEEMRHIMSYAGAIVGASNYSFITTNAVTYALRRGARFLSLPLSTNDGTSLFEQDFLNMSPQKARRMAIPLLWGLRSASTLHVTTRRGTNITFSIKNRKAGLFCGVASKPGTCSSASFEVYVPPVETSASGRVVLDGSMGYIGLVKKPLTLEFTGGRLTGIENTPDGARLNEFMEHFHDDAMYHAAEFGIGLNQCARCRGASYIEDESAYGTFHIGFGRNLALGGNHNAAGHFDIVTHNPTIFADNTMIMQDGKVCTNIGGRFLYL